jgi:exodeoxyribonuclease-3
MKIISFNVNGIRSAISKGLLPWLEEENPDLLCLQEIKAQADQIDLIAFQSLGYRQALLYPAQKKGYSGVAIFSKTPADYHQLGIRHPLFDAEGRLIRADFGDLTLVCVYIPSGTSGEIRQTLKMEFLDHFTDYLLQLRQERPKLVICGDYNICRQPIDISHPERHTHDSGFLPEERQWFDQFLQLGFIDSFREINPDPNHYTWWSYRANSRAKNLGWRIDYHIITPPLRPQLADARILPHVQLADHCPILLELNTP